MSSDCTQPGKRKLDDTCERAAPSTCAFEDLRNRILQGSEWSPSLENDLEALVRLLEDFIEQCRTMSLVNANALNDDGGHDEDADDQSEQLTVDDDVEWQFAAFKNM